MEYKVSYKVKNKMSAPKMCNVSLDGEIGARTDRFLYERVWGEFALKEILGETEDFFNTKFDDEIAIGYWRSEFWGKYILGAIDVCKYKKDENLKERIKTSVYKVLAFQREDGYLSTYEDSENIFPADTEITLRDLDTTCNFNWNVWGKKYTLWALLEAAKFLDDNHILECGEKLADHFVVQIKRLGVRVKDTGVMDGMPSCSILLPMLELYRLSGKEEYFDFCTDIIKQWEREDGEKPNLVLNAFSDKAPAHWYEPEYEWFAKTYEMLSCFEGILEYYRISGNSYYLEAVEAFYDQLVKYELNILGGVGHAAIFEDGVKFAEAGTELCDVIHWMKLCFELYLVTGKAKYMDSYENAYFNAFMAGIYADGKSGAFMVRSHGMHQFATPDVETKYQNCCLANMPRGIVNGAISLVAENEDGYFVNVYGQGTVRFGKTLIRISTGYLTDGKLHVTVKSPEKKKLYLRMPEWTENTRVKVKGVENIAEGEYCEVSLNGDTVAFVTFDVTPKIIEMPEGLRQFEKGNRHINRWLEFGNGYMTDDDILKHSVCAMKKGALLLARSKKAGYSGEEIATHYITSKEALECEVVNIRHDGFMCLCRVKITKGEEVYNYTLCDYASASDFYVLDNKYFTIYL